MMQKTDLRALAMSIGKEAWASEVGGGGMTASAGPNLGRCVPWGGMFSMGVNIEDAMRTSVAHGTRKVDFSVEVRQGRPQLQRSGLLVASPKIALAGERHSEYWKFLL